MNLPGFISEQKLFAVIVGVRGGNACSTPERSTLLHRRRMSQKRGGPNGGFSLKPWEMEESHDEKDRLGAMKEVGVFLTHSLGHKNSILLS